MKDWNALSKAEKLGIIAAILVLIGDAFAIFTLLSEVEEK